jgi:hypothetical protein
MGFNTTIFVLNDQWSFIEKDPEKWVRQISAYRPDGYIPGTTVMPTAHADVFRLYATHMNSIVELSEFSEETRRQASSPQGRADIEGWIRRAEVEIRGLKRMLKELPCE